MKLIRFGNKELEKPGILSLDGERFDLSNYFTDWNPLFFNTGGLEKLQQLIAAGTTFPKVPLTERWASPFARPGKIICIGLNYSDHAKESGMELPTEPIIFQKAANTIAGPFDQILIPRKSHKTDWEVELGVVIGKNASYLDSPEQSREYIAGYCVANDVSEREFQLERGGQWTKGKSCDTFSPVGPFLATQDEIDNVNNLAMHLSVNGQTMQTGNTCNMVFDVYYIVYYLSQFMTLEAGDLILTGTPPGVGLGKKPQVFLKEDDEVELSIEGLGTQKQTCKNA